MEWNYAVGQEARGPFSDAEMVQLIQSGEIRGGTQVWNAELPGWIEARASTLASHFAVPPPVPSPSIPPLTSPPLLAPRTEPVHAAPPESSVLRLSAPNSLDGSVARSRTRQLALSSALLSAAALLIVVQLVNIGFQTAALNPLVFLGGVLVLLAFAVIASFWCYEWLTDGRRNANGKAQLNGTHILIGSGWTFAAAIGIFKFLEYGVKVAAKHGEPVASKDANFLAFLFLSGLAFVAVMGLARLASRFRPAIPLPVSGIFLAALLITMLAGTGGGEKKWVGRPAMAVMNEMGGETITATGPYIFRDVGGRLVTLTIDKNDVVQECTIGPPGSAAGFRQSQGSYSGNR